VVPRGGVAQLLVGLPQTCPASGGFGVGTGTRTSTFTSGRFVFDERGSTGGSVIVSGGGVSGGSRTPGGMTGGRTTGGTTTGGVVTGGGVALGGGVAGVVDGTVVVVGVVGVVGVDGVLGVAGAVGVAGELGCGRLTVFGANVRPVAGRRRVVGAAAAGRWTTDTIVTRAGVFFKTAGRTLTTARWGAGAAATTTSPDGV
jgi:hypothetical protein